MQRYRCFLLDAHGTIRGAEVIGAENDAEAWRKARRLLEERPCFRDVQVWEQGAASRPAAGASADGHAALRRERPAIAILRKLTSPRLAARETDG
jgi:hypothetical protein